MCGFKWLKSLQTDLPQSSSGMRDGGGALIALESVACGSLGQVITHADGVDPSHPPVYLLLICPDVGFRSFSTLRRKRKFSSQTSTNA